MTVFSYRGSFLDGSADYQLLADVSKWLTNEVKDPTIQFPEIAVDTPSLDIYLDRENSNATIHRWIVCNPNDDAMSASFDTIPQVGIEITPSGPHNLGIGERTTLTLLYRG